MSDSLARTVEFPVSDAVALRVIQHQFPAIGATAVTARYAGCDNQAVEIDGSYIFRFPQRTEGEPALRRELEVLRATGPLLPVASPHYEWIGRPTDEYPLLFAGYKRLPGIPAIDTSLSQQGLNTLAHQLGSILGVIHGCDLAPPGVDRWPSTPFWEPDPAGDRDCALSELEDLRESLEPSLYDFAAGFMKRQSWWNLFSPPVKLVHGDLSAEHLLIDPESERLTAVIDWTDAFAGDPAYDCGYLWEWQGQPFIERLLASYPYAVDETFLERAQFYGLCTTISECHYGIFENNARYLEMGLSALRREVSSIRGSENRSPGDH